MNSDNNNIQQVRYSDEELEEFKVLILEKLAQAKESLETLIIVVAHANEDF